MIMIRRNSQNGGKKKGKEILFTQHKYRHIRQHHKANVNILAHFNELINELNNTEHSEGYKAEGQKLKPKAHFSKNGQSVEKVSPL